MRSTRIRKFRVRNRPLFIIVKTAIVCYLIMFSASYLTSDTSANFTSQQEVNHMITASDWEIEDPEMNESALIFLEIENQNIKTCPAIIKIEIKNDGSDMLADTTYEIYYIENGNPKKHGEKIVLADGEGVIPVLTSGESFSLIWINGARYKNRIYYCSKIMKFIH